MPSALRIIDANANRAREGLRVVEDYARFVLNDPQLSARLKAVRHALAHAVPPEAVLHRDSAGDVGTAVKLPDELHRPDLAAVVVAAGKRVGEGLRAVEECLKTLDPPAAARVEAARYAFYDAERDIAFTLRPRRFDGVRLYVLITESACRGDWYAAAEAAVAGGASCLQLREKHLDGGELLARARRLAALCKPAGVLFVVNDRLDVAQAAGADGVHLGQTDLPARAARKLVGPGMLLGVSTHTMEQAHQAVADGADYVGVGPVYPSTTKPRDFLPGLAFAEQAASLPVPAVAIAGITLDRVPEVLATGVKAVAVTQAVVGALDVKAAAAAFKAALPDPA